MALELPGPWQEGCKRSILVDIKVIMTHIGSGVIPSVASQP